MTIHSDHSADGLLQALLDGEQDSSVVEARKLIGVGLPIRRLITDGIEVAMAQLDAKCAVERFNLFSLFTIQIHEYVKIISE